MHIQKQNHMHFHKQAVQTGSHYKHVRQHLKAIFGGKLAANVVAGVITSWQHKSQSKRQWNWANKIIKF